MNAILKDLMRFTIAPKQQAIAVWAPFEFFLVAGRVTHPEIAEAAAEKELGLLQNYVVFAVSVSTDDEEGRKVPFPESTLRSMTRLRLRDGKTLTPLAPKDLSPKLAATLGALRGAMQQGSATQMELIVFPNKTVDGTPIIRATRPGRIALDLAETGAFHATSFTWHTPLDSLVDPTTCPKCQEPMSASWSFCPFCGQGSSVK